MIDLDTFDQKMRRFPANYMSDFDGFWKWKLRIEHAGSHILANENQRETHRRLLGILGGWQTYRVKGLQHSWRETLAEALAKAAEAYNEIRNQNILDLDRTSEEALQTIWNQLGRVKESDGQATRDGEYFIIAVSKPLMLLWGQTPAFDSHVRKSVPLPYGVPHRHRWTFNEWRGVLKRFQADLRENPTVVAHFKETAKRRYETALPTPYGRFLDIYYY